MANKPRIAFCFSWQARTLDQTYLFFQRNLFDAAKEQWFDYDIFCAVEDDEDVDKVNLLNPTKIEKIKSSEVEKIIETKYGEFIRTAFRTKYKRAYYTYEKVVNYLQQIFKVSSSIKLCGNCERYVLIVRLRFDTIFINKLNFKSIVKNLKNRSIICNNQEDSSIFWKVCHSTYEIQDFFFIWDSKSMKILWDIFENFEQCFMWHEVKPLFKPIYYISNWIWQFLLFVNNNTKFHILSLPKEFGAYMIFIPEKAYYEYFLWQNINVIKENISLILIRKFVKTSYIRLEDKTKYEL
jgi:hypothetical protein